MARILVTGAAGFIGYHLCNGLRGRMDSVVAIDNLNDYYDVHLKQDRIAHFEQWKDIQFIKMDLTEKGPLSALFESERFDVVVNLAAQPGVRYSLINPYAYIDSNIVGFLNILEGCRRTGVKHLVFASSSSVYGMNTKMPFSVHDNVDHPVSLYAATKKSNELMAHAYANLYKLPCTGLRFFTVYGPWGRPDMAYFSFTKAILEGTPIDIFNEGRMRRDFTYIDDIVKGIAKVIDRLPRPDPAWDRAAPDPATSYAPYRIYNIGNNNTVELMRFIETLETCLGKKAVKNYLPMQAGDVPSTYADVGDLIRDVGFKPSTPIEVGLEKFVEWYKGYYR
jgi:UDP-glucuronate 4-epimerase